jgi:hypothetical protein
VRSQSIVQNIINNNYNINNVTNTGVSNIPTNLSSCKTEKTMNSFQELTPESTPQKEKPEMLTNVINGEANKTMNIMIKTFDSFKTDPLVNESEMTRVTGEGLYNGSEIQKSHVAGQNGNFMELSYPNDSFANFKKPSKKHSFKKDVISAKDSEMGITITLNQIEQKMDKTDFKGRPLNEESDQSSENSIDEDKEEDKDFNREDNNPFYNYKSPANENKMIPKPRKSINKLSPNMLTRTTCINLLNTDFLKPLKSNMSINPKIQELKSVILSDMGKKHERESSDSDAFYEEENKVNIFNTSVNFDKDDNEGPNLQNLSELKDKIEQQLNPKRSNRKQTMHVRFEGNHVRRESLGHNRFYSTKVSQRPSIVKGSTSIKFFAVSKTFKDLLYVCVKDMKFLKLFHTDKKGIHLLSTKNFSSFKSICFDQMKKIVISEKDKFLMVIHFREENQKTKEIVMNQIILEIPTRKKLLVILKNNNLNHCIVMNKSLKIEGDDPFKNSSLNLFPKAIKQGFLELFVNDFFNDWKTFFVSLVDKTLFLFPVNRKNVYKDYKSTLRKVKIYRLISVNLITNTNKIGLNKSFSFCLKLNHEKAQLVFSAFNRRERKEWLSVL